MRQISSKLGPALKILHGTRSRLIFEPTGATFAETLTIWHGSHISEAQKQENDQGTEVTLAASPFGTQDNDGKAIPGQAQN